MNDLLPFYWMPMVAATALGLAVGAMSASGPSGGRRSVVVAAGLLAAAVAAALLRWPPGRAGLWLETGILLAGCYLGGCALGCLLGRHETARRAEDD